jgi:cyanophycinase-like exopeptidase
MVMLMGGGVEADAAFINRGFPVANGGDVVVLRTDNSNGYNSYLFNLVTGTTKPDSVETLVVDTVAKANTDYVYWAIRSAELVFIAGGNQSTYINVWSGTKVATAMNEVYARGGVVGGTSAGNHVMGRWIYDPDGVTAVISSEALANPYRSSMIISDQLFNFPLMANVVTDTHFTQRDRMGRSMAFRARLRQDGRATSILNNICVDERTCISIDRNGIGFVDGTNSVYVFQEDGSTVLQQCVSGQPLIYNQVKRTRLTNGQSFDFNTNTGGTLIPISVNGSSTSPFTPINPY